MRERLKNIRKELGYTQAEFAEKLGLTTTSYNYLENGKTPLQDKHIKAICGIFRLNETWLRTGIGEKFTQDDISREIINLTGKMSIRNQRLFLRIASEILNDQFEQKYKEDMEKKTD